MTLLFYLEQALLPPSLGTKKDCAKPSTRLSAYRRSSDLDYSVGIMLARNPSFGARYLRLRVLIFALVVLYYSWSQAVTNSSVRV